MIEELKTTVIGFDKNEADLGNIKMQPTSQINVNDTKEDNVIKNVLFNVTTKVPHVTTSVVPVEVQPQEEEQLEGEIQDQELKVVKKKKTLKDYNKYFDSIPKFYLAEVKRFKSYMVLWILITLACIGLETWTLISIIKNPNINNWTALTLIPGLVLSLAFLIVYSNNYVNIRNEARNVNFSTEKVVTTNVLRLYKRLKTGHINVNWFCLLTYVASLMVIGIDYLIAGAKYRNWGKITPAYTGGNPAFLVTLIVAIVAIFVALFAHIFLLVSNYVRAGKIDSFYSVQIVSDEELDALKKKKNKRNAIIFIAVIVCIALIGILIYKLVNRKKQTNNITINNK